MLYGTGDSVGQKKTRHKGRHILIGLGHLPYSLSIVCLSPVNLTCTLFLYLLLLFSFLSPIHQFTSSLSHPYETLDYATIIKFVPPCFFLLPLNAPIFFDFITLSFPFTSTFQNPKGAERLLRVPPTDPVLQAVLTRKLSLDPAKRPSAKELLEGKLCTEDNKTVTLWLWDLLPALGSDCLNFSF